MVHMALSWETAVALLAWRWANRAAAGDLCSWEPNPLVERSPRFAVAWMAFLATPRRQLRLHHLSSRLHLASMGLHLARGVRAVLSSGNAALRPGSRAGPRPFGGAGPVGVAVDLAVSGSMRGGTDS